MKQIEIQNKDLLEKLNSFYEKFEEVIVKDKKINKEVLERIEKEYSMNSPEPSEYYVSQDYLNYLLNFEKGTHIGWPKHSKQFTMMELFEIDSLAESEEARQKRNQLVKQKNELCEYLLVNLSSRAIALQTYYPAGGMISWHTNWNVPGHNIVFTRSSSEKSYFKFLDWRSKEVITLHDNIGWTCRVGKFGEKNSEDVLYHCAESFGDRITIGLSFAKEDEIMHNMAQEFITTE